MTRAKRATSAVRADGTSCQAPNEGRRLRFTTICSLRDGGLGPPAAVKAHPFSLATAKTRRDSH
jgi:hypothetical protein